MGVLLTGATGFIGGFLGSQHQVTRIVVRQASGNISHTKPCFLVDSIDGKTNWTGAFDGISTVIHLAGRAHAGTTKDSMFAVNTEGTLHFAREAARSDVKRFVFVSSIGVNGRKSEGAPFNESSRPSPHNAYAQSKFDAETGLSIISQQTGLEVVIVRPTLVYGPGAPGSFGLLIKLVRKLPVLPFGLTRNRRSFIAVQNLCDLLLTCATHPKAPGHIFFASDGYTVSTREFIDHIAAGIGKKIYQLPIPTCLMCFAGNMVGKSGLVDQLFGDLEVDSSNAQSILNWLPPLTMAQAMEGLKISENVKNDPCD